MKAEIPINLYRLTSTLSRSIISGCSALQQDQSQVEKN
jgi:hypothetical protein